MTGAQESTNMTRERNDTGQYIETVELDDVLDVFERVRGPVITSSDVSDALDCTTEAARQKLTRLYDQTRVDRRKTGRTMVYWRVNTPDEFGADGLQGDPSTTLNDTDADE